MRSISYSAQFLCEFNEISDSLQQVILSIINCDCQLLDLSKIMVLNQEISSEMEEFGMAFIALAQAWQARMQEDNSESLDSKNGTDNVLKYRRTNVETNSENNSQNSHSGRLISRDICAPNGHETSGSSGKSKQSTERFMYAESMVTDFRKKIAEERQRNCKLELEIAQLRVTQDEHLSRLEVRLNQAEVTIAERLTQKPFEEQKEAKQNVLRNATCEQLEKKSEQSVSHKTANRLVLPQCHDRSNQKVCEQNTGVVANKSSTKKTSLQLEEAKKWSKIAPVSVLGARKRFQHGLATSKKKI